MHALVSNGVIQKYPYNVAQLKQDNPNCSFPQNLSDELLSSFGMNRVFFSTPPVITDTQILEEDTPVFDTASQRWTQVWSVRGMTAEEVSARYDAQAASIRAERNKLISDTDWMALTDNTMTPEWVAYRQELRDVTSQSGFPFNIVWPVAP